MMPTVIKSLVFTALGILSCVSLMNQAWKIGIRSFEMDSISNESPTDVCMVLRISY